jgi:hypothetical protein
MKKLLFLAMLIPSLVFGITIARVCPEWDVMRQIILIEAGGGYIYQIYCIDPGQKYEAREWVIIFEEYLPWEEKFPAQKGTTCENKYS